MSRKTELKRLIKACEEEIENLEKKRLRSQSSLLSNLLSGIDPDESDKEYYKVYTQMIEHEREKLHEYREELESLE